MRRSLVCVALVTGSLVLASRRWRPRSSRSAAACCGSGSPIRRRSIRIRSSTPMDFGLSLDQAP